MIVVVGWVGDTELWWRAAMAALRWLYHVFFKIVATGRPSGVAEYCLLAYRSVFTIYCSLCSKLLLSDV